MFSSSFLELGKKKPIRADLTELIEKVNKVLDSHNVLNDVRQLMEPVINEDGYPIGSPLLYSLLGVEPIPPCDTQDLENQKADLVSIKEGIKDKIKLHSEQSDQYRAELTKKKEFLAQSQIFLSFHPAESQLHTMTLGEIEKAEADKERLEAELAKHQQCCPVKEEKLSEVRSQIKAVGLSIEKVKENHAKANEQTVKLLKRGRSLMIRVDKEIGGLLYCKSALLKQLKSGNDVDIDNVIDHYLKAGFESNGMYNS